MAREPLEAATAAFGKARAAVVIERGGEGYWVVVGHTKLPYETYASAWDACKLWTLALAVRGYLGVSTAEALGKVRIDEEHPGALNLWRRFLRIVRLKGNGFREAEASGRGRPGEQQPLASMEDADVWELLRDPRTAPYWAGRLGVTEGRIRTIRSGEAWKHIERPKVRPPWPKGRPPKDSGRA